MMSRVFPALLVAALAVLPLVMVDHDVGIGGSVSRQSLAARPWAEALLVQQQALLAWARANPGFTGAVAQASLTIPGPWTAPSQVASLVGDTAAGPVAVTWYLGTEAPAAAMTDALVHLHAYAQDVGRTAGGVLVSPAGTFTSLPAGVPAGVPAVADLVTP
jgi:hypothetical protein